MKLNNKNNRQKKRKQKKFEKNQNCFDQNRIKNQFERDREMAFFNTFIGKCRELE